jgi:hypothetical protein
VPRRPLVAVLLTVLLTVPLLMIARPSPAAAALAAAPAAAPAAAGAAPRVAVPAEGRAVRARATRFVGHGTARSCTSRAVVRAVAKGGVIKFRCGRRPVTIAMKATAKVVNTSRRVVIDGGGKVTLDGLGRHRILYLNTCDAKQGWTTSHCDDQRYPELVVQHLTLKNGYDGGDSYEHGGGGAIFDRGGQLRIVDTRFVRNRCRSNGPDVGGAAVRALEQWRDRPVYVVDSVFRGGRCSNGAGLSSIGVSWRVLNSVFRNNVATGHGANPARRGTPGGGSGGAIYLDGNTFTLELAGTTITNNVANEGGGAVFFVSNDRTGSMSVSSSVLRSNPSRGFENYPGIFFLGRGRPAFTDSVVR